MKPSFRNLITIGVFLSLCFFAYYGGLSVSSEANVGPWYSVVPPLLAITLAVLTRRLLLSLVVAVLVGGFLTTLPLAPLALSSWGNGAGNGVGFIVKAVTDPINLLILAFIAPTLTMITIIVASGGFLAVVKWLSKFSTGPRSTQFMTALMGVAIFFDDYTNTMIVGSTMRPVTDRNKVSREKLAFLVDATSAPIAGIAVVSTWIGYEVGLFSQTSQSLNFGRDGYAMFFDALPFRFYCMFMIIFVFLNVLFGREFGAMAKAEKRAQSSGKLWEKDAQPLGSNDKISREPYPKAQLRITSALLPISGLLGLLLIGLWVDGGGIQKMASDALAIFKPLVWRDVITAAENSIALLAIGAAVGLSLSMICARVLGKLPYSYIGKAFLFGLKASCLPMAILIMAWSLKNVCDGLETGTFLAQSVGQMMSPIWFPALLFIAAGMTAFATGTSWGTMAILIPAAAPLAFQLDGEAYGLVTMMSLAAVLDGAIFGDHCSPISDTTIMSSISTSCDNLHHVRTQLPYATAVAFLALSLGYLPSAFGVPTSVSLLLAVVFICALFITFGRKTITTEDQEAPSGLPSQI